MKYEAWEDFDEDGNNGRWIVGKGDEPLLVTCSCVDPELSSFWAMRVALLLNASEGKDL